MLLRPSRLLAFLGLLAYGGSAFCTDGPGSWDFRLARDLAHFRVGDDDKFVSAGFTLEGRARVTQSGALWLTASHRFSSFRTVSEDDEDHDNPEDVEGLAAFRFRASSDAIGLLYRGPTPWGLAPTLGLEGRWTRMELVSRSGGQIRLQEPLLMLRVGVEHLFPRSGISVALEGGAPLHRFRSDKWTTLGTMDDAGLPLQATFTAPATAWDLRFSVGSRF